VVIPPAEPYDEVARAVQDAAQRAGLPRPAVLRLAGDPAGISHSVTELSRARISALFFFGDTRVLDQLAVGAVARQWYPRLFLPGQTAGSAIFALPQAFDGRIHLAYPNLLQDQSTAGRAEFAALRKQYTLPPGHAASQVRALAAAKVLVEALRRAGRSLTRGGVMAELERLDKYETGHVPPLSFAANRRVGARGAHVLTVDLPAGRFRPEVAWVAVD
jgi:ABC-type branched-subunit amino acid transport system substrate-binding protein